jgi:hypothetical protein
MLEAIEAFGAGQIERVEYQGIQDGKDNGVCADGDGESDHGNNGEAGRLAQDAQGEAGVLEKGLKESAARSFAGFFFVANEAAELDACAALGFGGREARALEIVGTMLHVRAKLLVHVGGELGATEEGSDAETKGVDEPHSASDGGRGAERAQGACWE